MQKDHPEINQHGPFAAKPSGAALPLKRYGCLNEQQHVTLGSVYGRLRLG